MKLLKSHFHFSILLLFSLAIFAISVRVTMFRYRNYEYGKFDLGNMSQMVYNTLNGNFMEVTDYFGTNMPRWGMSHVDPFLLVFVPVYALFPDARVLVVGQLTLLISAASIFYLISTKVLGSKTASLFLSLSFLFYPAVGYLLAWSGFHGVTAVVPFFLLAFLLFETMHADGMFSKKRIALFCLLIILTLSGKEEISLIIALYGLFIVFFRRNIPVGVGLFALGVVWFLVSFLILIPGASKYRIDGYQRFADSLGLEDIDPSRDVLKSNYFISRYDEFGSGYTEIVKNVLLNPGKVGEVIFSGDKKENFTMTFKPLLFLPFFYLPVFLIAMPEFAINYLTTSGGIGTSEIYNHRISMIIPILFLSVLFSLKFFERFSTAFFNKSAGKVTVFISFAILLSNIYASNLYGNPILLWFTQSVQRRLAFGNPALAAGVRALEAGSVGEQVKLNRLETKDTRCFDEAVKLVSEKASVSAPDYLGAHLSSRRINALFPANFDSSEFVIVDVFSRKVATVLGVDSSIVNDAVGKVVRNPGYSLIYSCSNLFVFKSVEKEGSAKLLPLQEDFDYQEKFNYKIGQSLVLVDFEFPERVERGAGFNTKFVYKKEGDDSLNSYILYTSFMNRKTGELYQIANLPSFGISPLSSWNEDFYYIEKNELILPRELPEGKYGVFIGMTNSIKTFNIYLGDSELL